MATSRSVLAVPLELRARPQWVGWRYERRNGTQTKIPINARTGREAKSNDPKTWSTFDEALAAVERFDCAGVGFVFSADDDFFGVDLDGCRDRDTGELTP